MFFPVIRQIPMKSLQFHFISFHFENNCLISSSKCIPAAFLSAAGTIDPIAMASLLPNANADDCEIKPGIAEMIREEERVSNTQLNI